MQFILNKWKFDKWRINHLILEPRRDVEKKWKWNAAYGKQSPRTRESHIMKSSLVIPLRFHHRKWSNLCILLTLTFRCEFLSFLFFSTENKSEAGGDDWSTSTLNIKTAAGVCLWRDWEHIRLLLSSTDYTAAGEATVCRRWRKRAEEEQSKWCCRTSYPVSPTSKSEFNWVLFFDSVDF